MGECHAKPGSREVGLFIFDSITRLLRESWLSPAPFNERACSNPFRYLCDFIYYCSLAESKRGEGGGDDKVVLFVHVPAIGMPFSVEDLTMIMLDIVAWLASRY